MERTKEYKIDEIVDRNWINPIVDKSLVSKNLINLLSQKTSKKELEDIKFNIRRNLLNKNFDKRLRNRSKNIIFKVYWSGENYIKDSEAKKRISLLQTAFIEMESLFTNIDRKQESKNGFDHILGVIDELLETPNVDIKHFIIALLHDWPEEFPRYTIDHIRQNYWDDIANSIYNMTKKNEYYYMEKWLKEENKNIVDLSNLELHKLIIRTKQDDYYGNMINWWEHEIWVKFADRIDSLKSIEWTWKEFSNKKLFETKIYFLNHEIRKKTSPYLYEKLKKIYFDKI